MAFANSSIMPAPLSAHAGHYLIETINASAASTVEFTTGIDSTYKKYVIECTDGDVGTSSVQLHGRASSDGGSTWDSGASDYEYINHWTTTGGTHAMGQSTGTSAMVFTSQGNVLDAHPFNLNMEIYDPSNASAHTMFFFRATHIYTGTQTGTHSGQCKHNTAAAVNGIQIYASSGTISGTFKLYGIK